MIREAIILAGGMGTRLRSAVPELPKCLAPVAGKPFLSFVIDYLRLNGIERIVFSLGYKAEAIISFLEEAYPTLEYEVVVEQEPLGTGGAIKASLTKITGQAAVVTNGDTLFQVPVRQLLALHQKSNALCTLALKPMQNFDRYGVVQLGEEGKVSGFAEKQFYNSGLINGGLYIVDKSGFENLTLPEKFSFEKEFLEPQAKKGQLFAAPFDVYFIDIGIPEDFARANTELQQLPLNLKLIDDSWTLFVDRDGVINEEIDGTYVLHKDGFNFMPGVPQALSDLSKIFGRIIVISNQRGVGRGLMTANDLQGIHQYLLQEVTAAGGRIDEILVCTEVNAKHAHRKPNPGMAMLAFERFPNIVPAKTIMVGNKLSDMQFGRWAGVYTIYLKTTHPLQPLPHPLIDAYFNNLPQFVAALGQKD